MSGPTVTQERTFAIVPESVIFHPELTGNDIRIYALIAWRAGDENDAWPGVRGMAEDLGLSTHTVTGSLERLEAKGVIQVTRRVGRVNHYHLPARPVTRDRRDNRDTPSRRSRHTVAESATELDTGTRPSNKTPPSPPIEEAEVWARRWADLVGVPATKSVLRRWKAQIEEIRSAGGEITDELLEFAQREGIKHPAGWPHVASGMQDREAARRAEAWMATR